MDKLKSRKFLLALVALIVQVALVLYPETRPYADRIGGILFAIVAVGTATITLEDVGRAWAERPVNVETAVRDLVSEVVDAAFPKTSGESIPVIAPHTDIIAHG